MTPPRHSFLRRVDAQLTALLDLFFLVAIGGAALLCLAGWVVGLMRKLF